MVSSYVATITSRRGITRRYGTPQVSDNIAQRRGAHAGYASCIIHRTKPRRGFTAGVAPRMSQSLVQIYVHIIFSTKNREALLQDKEFRAKAHAYLAGICKNLGCPALVIGGVEDHVHILCRLGKTIEIATLVRELKRDSSKWIKENNTALDDFHWQAGYGAFSVSPSHIDALVKYIRNQEEHHHRESFQDEFRWICKKYGVEFDERYVWE